MIHDDQEGQTHSYNDGCGIKEHNMTLREKWDLYVKSTIEDLNLYSKPSADWFLAQFDAMLAEDIEKMELYYSPNHEAHEESLNATRILEARRLELKK